MTTPSPSAYFSSIYPHDVTAEQSVLGAILLDGRVLDELTLKPEDFHVGPHQVIFRAMRELATAKSPVDAVTLANHLRSTGFLEAASGAAYTSGLTDVVPSIAHAQHYARIVRDHSRRRGLIWRLKNAIDAAAAAGDADSAIADVDRILASDDPEDLAVEEERDVIGQVMRRVDENFEKASLRGIETGIRSVDDELFLNPTDLVVLGGRPGNGKSIFASQIADHVGKSRGPVLFISLEMRPDEIVTRRLMDRGQLEIEDIRKPRTDAAAKKLVETCDTLYRESRVRYFRSRQLGTILRAAMRLKRRDGLALLVIDYLQRLDLDRAWGDNKDQQIGHVTSTLKSFADDNEVPVLLLSQLRRLERVSKKNPTPAIPTIDDLRESGNIEADANAVLLLHIPGLVQGTKEYAADDDRKTLAIVAKQRSGPSRRFVELVAQFEFARFREPLQVAIEKPEEPKQATMGFGAGRRRGAGH